MEESVNTPERISRLELFSEMAKLVSRRSSCLKKQVGAILVKENRVIAMGYNGVLAKENPLKGMDDKGVTHTVHAEANIISFCAKNGIATEGTTMYITLSPCEKCVELIIQAGITEVVYYEEYRDYAGVQRLLENDIRVSKS
jgi:dCMP deaminase